MRLLHLALLAQASLAAAAPNYIHIRSSADLAKSYDYVIIGGGVAGLVVGNRLSEDPKTTVLVIEAGPLMPDPDFTIANTPGYLFSEIMEIGSRYDWNITSLPDAARNNRTTQVLTRKIVGGGSQLNYMFLDRGSKRDYDDWGSYTGDPSWSFDGLLPYFKKAETFHPPPKEIAEEWGIEWNPEAHGTDGPLQSSYPPFLNPLQGLWKDALMGLGIPMPKDGADGHAIGVFWVPNSVDPERYTRSSSRTSFHEQAKGRKNYHLLSGNTVTQILIKNKKAYGVKYAASASSPVQQVLAKKEVVVSGGGVHSPRMLQLSGIGDKRLLNKLKIPVVVDLPGVGNNYQDRPLSSMSYEVTGEDPNAPYNLFNETIAAPFYAEYLQNQTGPFTAGVPNNVAFLPLKWISPRYKSLVAAAAARDDRTHLRPGLHPTVLAGYARQKELLLASHSSDEAAIMEQVSTAASLQRPLSRGYVEIKSTNPFDLPDVDYRTLSNEFDLLALTDSIRWVRKVAGRPELAVMGYEELAPGKDVTSDEGIGAWLRETMEPTWWHSSCTCAVGKKEFGGVVDTEFRVHGVKGLRVVDASVFPMVPGTHTQNTVYAVAEKAADAIKKGQKA